MPEEIKDPNPVSPLSDHTWRFCARSGCSEPKRLDTFLIRYDARWFLSDAWKNPQRRQQARSFIDPQRVPSGLLEDEDVFRLLADMLKTGQVHIHAELIPRIAGVPRKEEEDEPESSSSRVPTVSAPAPEQPTFSNVISAQQAQALKNAALSGVPFCAECAAENNV